MAFLQAWMRIFPLPLTKPPILRLCRKYFNGGNKSEDFLFHPNDTLERPTDDLPHPGGCRFVCIHHMNVSECLCGVGRRCLESAHVHVSC